MWVASDRLQVIETAVERGQRGDVGRLLVDLPSSTDRSGPIPVACPTCAHDLVRHTLPTGTLSVTACPAGHGAWVAGDDVDALRRFAGERATAKARAGPRRRVPGRLLAVLAVVVPLGLLATHRGRIVTTVVGLVDAYYDHQVDEDYWPARGWVYKERISAKAGGIDAGDELRYFARALALLDEGITNRINVHGVLKTRRTAAEYERLYAIYHERQRSVLDGLRGLAPPRRLARVHARLLAATQAQIRFFRAFVDAKLADGGVDLGRMLDAPDLKTANGELESAWSEIRRLYPRLDAETGSVIEHHLRGFEVS